MDNIRRARTEDTCAKENSSGENRPDPEAHRRCYSAKGVQSRIIAQFTSTGLIGGSSLHRRSPASGGAFLMVQLSRSGMNCLALRHSFVRRHSAPRKCINVLFTCKSKISPEGYHDTGTEDRMLDGKRYYRAFPDENPERPSVRAVLDALQKLEAQFRKHITQFRANKPKPKQESGQTKQSRARIANARKRGRTRVGSRAC